MKKTIALTLITLFFTFPSFANPIGKGLICKFIKSTSPNLFSHYVAFEFLKTTTFRYWFKLSNNDTITMYSDELFYSTTPKTILIKNSNYLVNWYLNRETLKLSPNKNYDGKFVRKCDAYSKVEFNLKIKELNKKLQNNFDAQTVKNKI
jgi:hypothetical protein